MVCPLLVHAPVHAKLVFIFPNICRAYISICISTDDFIFYHLIYCVPIFALNLQCQGQKIDVPVQLQNLLLTL